MCPQRDYKFVYDPEREITQLLEMMIANVVDNPLAVKDQLQYLLDNYLKKKAKPRPEPR